MKGMPITVLKDGLFSLVAMGRRQLQDLNLYIFMITCFMYEKYWFLSSIKMRFLRMFCKASLEVSRQHKPWANIDVINEHAREELLLFQ